MEIIPKKPWAKGDIDRRIKDGSREDRKLTADCIKIGRASEARLRENERRMEYNAFVLAVCIMTALILILAFSKKAHAMSPGGAIDVDIIADIESSNNPYAYNNGHVGLYQISEGVVIDFNDDMEQAGIWKGYSLNEMYNPIKAHEVAEWFFNIRIPSYLEIYGIPNTITSKIIAYNWGIGHLRKWFKNGSHWNRLPKETRDYVKKYYKGVMENE